MIFGNFRERGLRCSGCETDGISGLCHDKLPPPCRLLYVEMSRSSGPRSRVAAQAAQSESHPCTLWVFHPLKDGVIPVQENKVNSIAFGKSTSQRIYPEQNTPKIGWKLHKYGLKHALHTLDDHFR